MKIAHVNDLDLGGTLFNGFDLHRSLNDLGYDGVQIVLQKLSDARTVSALLNPHRLFINQVLTNLEDDLGIQSLLYPNAIELQRHEEFQSADIVHYHLLHNQMVSLWDLPRLFQLKKSVWTIHDPWIVSGFCIYPLECIQWLTGCQDCKRAGNGAKTASMWNIKKQVLRNLNIELVVSTDWMKNYLTRSPLTKHFKNITKIPFGIDFNQITLYAKAAAKNLLNIDEDSFVIAFRNERSEIKGASYLIDALRQLNLADRITVLTVGSAPLPKSLTDRYRCVELGWQNDRNALDIFYSAADLFVMPSLAESFGVMAIEAMAHGCPILVFENTVLTEITFAPKCGMAVSYKSSQALKEGIEYYFVHPEECELRGKFGRDIVKKHYQYSDYVQRHVLLYQSILNK